MTSSNTDQWQCPLCGRRVSRRGRASHVRFHKRHQGAVFTPDRRAAHRPMTLKWYHADTSAVSNSMRETLRAKGPAYYHGRYVTGEYADERTKAKDAGSIAHEALLCPQGLNGVLAVIPTSALNEQGHRKGAAWKKWAAEHEGRYHMKQEEAQPILAMVNAVRRHKTAAHMLDNRLATEYTIYWIDEETGLRLKCRPDLISSCPGGVALADFKVTHHGTLAGFMNQAVDLGYHRQAAFYWKGAEAMGLKVVVFVFIVVHAAPAYEVLTPFLEEPDYELGEEQNRLTLRDLAQHYQSDVWTPPGYGELLRVGLPQRAYKEDPWALVKN